MSESMTTSSARATLVELTFPPAPHDPRERDLALTLGDWEVRLFGGRKFQYFVTRGLWHVQLWHPRARVSILTPSRLTKGLYEVFPIENWKARAPSYAALETLLVGMTQIALPSCAQVDGIEKSLVDGVVRAGISRRTVLQ